MRVALAKLRVRTLRRRLLDLEAEIIAPEGYRWTSTFHYPHILIAVIEVITILLPIIVLGPVDYHLFLKSQQGQLTLIVAIMIIYPFFTRRILQRGVSRLLGYPLSWSSVFSIHIFYYMADFSVEGVDGEEYRSWQDALLMALTPLNLYIMLLIALLLEPGGTTRNILIVILFAGFLPTIADLYFICWLITKPRQAVLSLGRRTAWLFEPLSADQYPHQQAEVPTRKRSKKRKRSTVHHH
jgi:hypothetical protein